MPSDTNRPEGYGGEKARARLSPLAMLMPIGVCALIGAFTDAIARRAGIAPGLAVVVAGAIGLLWLLFFIGRLLDQAQR
jgi:hypothetical protein